MNHSPDAEYAYWQKFWGAREPLPPTRYHVGQRVRVVAENDLYCGLVGVTHHRLKVSGRWRIDFPTVQLSGNRTALGVYGDDQLEAESAT